MTPASPYRRAVDAAIRENRKPLADLTPDEAESLYERVLWHLFLDAKYRKVMARRRGDADG